jgi:hypothetical protein
MTNLYSPLMRVIRAQRASGTRRMRLLPGRLRAVNELRNGFPSTRTITARLHVLCAHYIGSLTVHLLRRLCKVSPRT